MESNEYYLDLPVTPELVDALGVTLMVFALLSVASMGISAAQSFKGYFVGRIRKEFGSRAAQQFEKEFPY